MSEDPRLEQVLAGLRGPRDSFRETLTNKDALLRKVCDYCDMQAKKRRLPAWSIMSDIMGHGSGVSAAIYQMYCDGDIVGEHREKLDAEYAAQVAECNGDPEGDHLLADSLLLELLAKLGMTKTVEAFQQLSKWYA